MVHSLTTLPLHYNQYHVYICALFFSLFMNKTYLKVYISQKPNSTTTRHQATRAVARTLCSSAATNTPPPRPWIGRTPTLFVARPPPPCTARRRLRPPPYRSVAPPTRPYTTGILKIPVG
jgi:hypothetical protein